MLCHIMLPQLRCNIIQVKCIVYTSSTAKKSLPARTITRRKQRLINLDGVPVPIALAPLKSKLRKFKKIHLSGTAGCSSNPSES